MIFLVSMQKGIKILHVMHSGADYMIKGGSGNYGRKGKEKSRLRTNSKTAFFCGGNLTQITFEFVLARGIIREDFREVGAAHVPIGCLGENIAEIGGHVEIAAFV